MGNPKINSFFEEEEEIQERKDLSPSFLLSRPNTKVNTEINSDMKNNSSNNNNHNNNKINKYRL